MPLSVYLRSDANAPLKKQNQCYRAKDAAIRDMIATHGRIVGQQDVARQGKTLDGRTPKPGTLYTFADGTQARFIAYAGMC